MTLPTSIQQAQQALATLRDPNKSLQAFGQVHDQKTSTFVPYDPSRLTKSLQQEILDYVSNPPLTKHGQTRFLTVLTGRQMGKSLASEYALYPKVAYTPGWDHVCIADTKDRAEYLHKRIHHLHERWPTQVRSRTVPNREARQLTFQPRDGGKMRVLSAETGSVGIGQSPDSFHASECAFWADFAGSMFLIWPSLINRDRALAIFECTPWEARSDWHHHCLEAKNNKGRHLYLFKPFWDGALNVRPWDSDAQLDNEEIALLERYGPEGLTQENLAFRRFIMDTDIQLRRNPDLFKVFYPYDDLSCWLTSSNAAIPKHALDKHINSPRLQPWTPPYREFQQPHPDAHYVIGVDPAGYAARDHAAFQVFKIFDDQWEQVAVFADNTDPIRFVDKLIRTGLKYNKATLVVESNGVGQATLALLREREYPSIFFEKRKRPGFTTTANSLERMMGWLTDALLETFVFYDRDTVEQLLSYRNDKRIEEAPSSEIARGKASPRRRERHHWDKISALLMVTVGARRAPARHRYKPKDLPPGKNPIHSGQYTFPQQTKRWEEIQRQKRRNKRRKKR